MEDSTQLLGVSIKDEYKYGTKDDTEPNVHCTRCQVVFGLEHQLKKHIRDRHTNLEIEKTVGKHLFSDVSDAFCQFENELILHQTPRKVFVKQDPELCVKTEGIGVNCEKCQMSSETNKLSIGECAKSKDLAFLKMEKTQGHICEICLKTFTKSSHLKRHTRTHTKEKLFPCPICQKSFYTSSDMSRHVKTHSGVKPFSCDICLGSFSRSENLKTHLMIHAGEKPFRCDICQKLYSRRNDLIRHTRSHSEHKPYSCDVCGKCFFRSAYLREHLRIHTGEKPYSCEVCRKKFAIRKNLRTHMAVHSEKTF